MPRGPKGEKRPADAIRRAVMIMKLAVGEISEPVESTSAAAELGAKGGAARAAKLSKKQRSDIAKRAAAARWKKKR